ncbi:MAG TPA: DUF2934 domain-containing protein [Burkholderiales bacterium]|nr:DUF2934 domain-containing protein [Burkholderiales bacterium]
MAKAKETKTVARQQPLQAKRPTKPAPDAPSLRPGGGKARGNAAAKLSPEEVYRLIQESAYFKAKARGFAPGNEVQDWIEAEAEVRRRLEGRAQQ